MDSLTSRYTADERTAVASGWRAEQVTPASSLFGANGIRLGPDGRLYVAQCFASRISAIDLASGAIEAICEMGGPMVAPDDIAFDSAGTMHVTDVMSAAVRARAPGGAIRTEAGDVPCANGITVHQDRVFIDECRADGRLLEILPNGDPPRVIAEHLHTPNALSAGPDGYLYFPLVAENEIWRAPIEGGAAERFVGGLSVPTAVKFDPQGNLASVQAGTGEVLRFDLQSRTRSRLAAVRPGLDNLEFDAAGTLYLSHFSDGGVSRIGPGGEEQILASPGLLGPYGICFGDDGVLYAGDGLTLAAVRDGACTRVGSRLDGRFPGWVRGVAAAPDGGLVVTTVEGAIVSYDPRGGEPVVHARGLDGLFGVAVDRRGHILACEGGSGRLLEIAGGELAVRASGLARPMGLAIGADGTCYVAEAAAGRVVAVNGGTATVLDGLVEPQGIALDGDSLFVLDAGARSLVAYDLAARRSATIASELPVGPQFGTRPRDLPGVPGRIPGPLTPFAGLAARDGRIYVGANGNGSIMAFARTGAASRAT